AVDAETGKTLARDLGDTWWSSPVANGHDVFFVSSHATWPGTVASAARLPTLTSEPFDATRLWTRRLGRYDRFSSPLYLPSGHLVLVDVRQNLTVLDAATGETVEERPLREGPVPEVWASPALAGSHIYVM